VGEGDLTPFVGITGRVAQSITVPLLPPFLNHIERGKQKAKTACNCWAACATPRATTEADMDLKALGNYREWLKRSPFEVYMHVLKLGGWKQVWNSAPFHGRPPRWASRVRNFFNSTPRKLTRLDDKTSETHLKQAQKAKVAAECATIKAIYDKSIAAKAGVPLELPKGCPANPDPAARMSFSDTMGTRHALSGDVYIDELRQIWFQMDPGGAIYHYGEKPWWPGGESVWVSKFQGQKQVPVFKLVSPDHTGGSRECCITNPTEETVQVGKIVVKLGRSNIGAVNQEVDVSGRVLTSDKHPVHQGSYNYAETVDQGLTMHNRFDVDTDLMLPTFFADPPDPFSQLLFRRFPEKKAGESTPLADQVTY
jgi:hypothetical protein